MEEYNFKKIEKKWQKFWEKEKIFKTLDNKKKPKFYVLDMFPYPSGSGLHVGHLKGYTATDIIARMKMMQGFNVLHPMGWDAFGLPAENFAIKNKIHPELAVKQNIKRYKEELKLIGPTYDWDREINTTDPNYYIWTQWIFLQLFKAGLVEESFEPINWCPYCKTGLANEDLEEGRCERCGSKVEKKPLRQWKIKITKYADRLLEDLEMLDWEEPIIKMQKDWIGKSEGVEFQMKIFLDNKETNKKIKVFTTRIDTILGMTYVVLAPEHEILEKLKNEIRNFDQIKKYQKEVLSKSDVERTKEKTGIKVEGILAENPLTKGKIPVFVSEYVLKDYGTGAIMAVPAHDKRDFEFAQKFNLPIKKVILSENSNEEYFEGEGILINSGEFTGLETKVAREKIVKVLEEMGIAKKTYYYKIKDWVFARQRYWGEPFPLLFCENCKKRILEKKYKEGEFNKGELLNPGWICVAEKNLPVKLPKVKYYEPTGTGEGPLANIKNWVITRCPKCGGIAFRETNTMPQWAGSCWYYLRYADPKNKKELISKEKEKYWLPVDLYVGGAEHATRHLIYARFWHKFLYDLGIVSTKEPFLKLRHVGLILGPDSRKMSKRYGNIITPEEICEKYGADALRLYEMFMGPFSQEIAWQEKGVIGMKRFLERIWKIKNKIKKLKEKKEEKNILSILHKTIKKVTEDIENFKFNTAISQIMIFFNELEKGEVIDKGIFELFLQLLSPFAPHLCEELWHILGNKESIFKSKWPQFNESFIKEEKEKFLLLIQINGKLRDRVLIDSDLEEKEIQNIVLQREKVKNWISNKKIKKIIFIKNKLINIVF